MEKSIAHSVQPTDTGNGVQPASTVGQLLTSATTASSSIGLKVQVEYTSRPPSLSMWQACRAMRSCRGCSPLPLPGVQRRQMSGALRMVPSPLQGTSQRMRSNKMFSCTQTDCQWQIATAWVSPGYFLVAVVSLIDMCPGLSSVYGWLL